MYYFTCVKTSWQNCILVQVRHMETHYWPRINTQGVTLVSGTSGFFLLLTNARGAQVSANTKHLTPALHTSERISNTAASSPVGSSGRSPFFWALNSSLECVPGTMHSTIYVLGGLDSCFLTPENDKWLCFKSARLAKCQAWNTLLQSPVTLW